MQLLVSQSINVMQNGIMTEQNFQQEEPVRAGSKRRSPPTVQSDSDDGFPSSPSGEKVVQTTKSKGIVNVQLFIRKAFAMINECDPTIACWTDEGDKFVVKNKDIFASTVIPQYYDHNNYSSFTRQLNFYGFTREQSMTIKVSDLSSLAVGQETFHHQYFQRGRPDLLKNLQRRSTDTKNSKKRKKPRTDGDVSFLQGRIENLEETAKEMMTTMKQMRDETFASAAAIQNLQSISVAKDEKINTLEKRIAWLERRLATSGPQRESSYISAAPRLDSGAGLLAGASAANFGTQGQNGAGAFPSSVAFPNNAGSTITTGAFGDSNAPTLARHPKMKKALANPPKDIFSYENANISINPITAGVIPSRETSLDFGLLSSLARETSLLSWLPRQENEKTVP